MTAADLTDLLALAEQHIAAQGRAYSTESDEDTAWRCAWNTWRTLADLVPAVRALLAQQPTEQPGLATITTLHPDTPRRTA